MAKVENKDEWFEKTMKKFEEMRKFCALNYLDEDWIEELFKEVMYNYFDIKHPKITLTGLGGPLSYNFFDKFNKIQEEN